MSSLPSTTDVTRALNVLESLQRDSYAQLGMTVPPPSKRSLEERRENFQRYLETNPEFTAEERRRHFEESESRDIDNNLLIAAFADEGANQILQQRVGELLSVWPEQRFPGVLAKTCFGLIPGGGLDAYTFRAEDSGAYCIVIPDGFFFLTNLFTKLVVLLQPWTPTNQGLMYFPSASFDQLGLANHPYLRFRARDLLHAYFVDGEPRAALPYRTAIPYQDHLVYLLIGVEIFVIAHELAHVALGHLEAFNGNAYDINAELAADALAFELLEAYFDKTANLGYVRATLCRTMFLSITRLWENGMQFALLGLGATLRSPSHPSFKQRHHHFVTSLASEESKPTPGWYIHIHNAILMATNEISETALEQIIANAGGIGGLSARVLPASHAHLGHMRTPRPDVWALAIGELLVSGNPDDRKLGLWFLANMAPGSAIHLYEGIVDEEEDVKSLCRDALCSIEPMYKSYMPRLLERFRETDKEDGLEEYKMHIASYLTGKAIFELGKERISGDPMNPSFFSEVPENVAD